MSEQVNKSIHPVLWVAGIAVILLSVTGIGAIMGWIPTSRGVNDSSVPTESTAAAEKPAETVEPPAAPKAERAPAKTQVVQQRVAKPAPAKPICADCGVVESIREVTQRGESSGVGVVGGAVVGGLLGNQIGGGHGKDAATVLGAVGGAVVGNEIEHRMKSTKAYEIRVRLDDGATTVIKESALPPWQPGDRVKVVSGKLRSLK